MKVNIEIDDDSKFFEALAQEIKKPQDIKAGEEVSKTDEFHLSRVSPQSFSCVAVSCNN